MAFRHTQRAAVSSNRQESLRKARKGRGGRDLLNLMWPIGTSSGKMDLESISGGGVKDEALVSLSRCRFLSDAKRKDIDLQCGSLAPMAYSLHITHACNSLSRLYCIRYMVV